MGAKGGLDPEVMTEAINRGSGRNSATQDKIPRSVLNRAFDYGAPMHILAKDVDYLRYALLEREDDKIELL